MPKLAITSLAIGLLFTSSIAPTAVAQTSQYFLMAGDQDNFHVLQAGSLVRSWGLAAGSDRYQYPIVVLDSVRTMGATSGDIGAEYDLNGNDLGTRYTHPASAPGRGWDGATDGQNNYSIDTGGVVTRFDLDWQNPVVLFDAGGLGGITFDPSNNSLWISQFSGSDIVEYSMSGTVLSSFNVGHTRNMALAMDYADGTLWLHDRNVQGTFEQWTTSGTLLTRVAVPGMASQNAIGGEFRFSSTVDIGVESVVVTRGTHVFGGIAELTESDNEDLTIQRAVSDIQSRTEFEVKAVSPVVSPSSLEVTLEGAVFARSTVEQSIELFDYDAGEWVEVDTTTANRFTDITVSAAASGDLSRFVEPGTQCIEARIRYQSLNPRQRFSSNTDQFFWTIGN